MNHIYRLCWNRSLKQWVPASELADCRHGGPSRGQVVGQRILMLSLLSVSLGMTGLAHAGGPSGGQIVGGSGQIQQNGDTTTIQQNSRVLSLNWQNFDVGANQTVNFIQPGADSIAVNRILGNTASEIDGRLNANGQVWLINPNGVIFGQGAQVNVGGIVASALDVDDSTVGTDHVRFAGEGKGKVTNLGAINVNGGGYAALIGNQVSNQGVIRAQLGTVALGGGSAVTLTFNDNHLLHLQVDKSTLNNLAENRQLIVADGGQVLMTAGARDSLLASVVNNTGTVQARTVAEHDGVITLLGGMEGGTVNVGGTLDASAPNGGDGGKIETSAAHFQLASDAKITAAAPSGKAGTWLVDPVDLTIDSSAATTISNTLNGGTSVTEQTTASGASGAGTVSSGNGDINVNAAISWNNAAATLELDAFRNINVNAAVTGSGGIIMNAASGTLTIGNAGGLSAGAGVNAQASKFVNNAGASALGSQWKLYTANPSLNTLGGIAPNFIQYNASEGSSLAGVGNALIYSVAPSLQITGLTGSTSKVYDGTTTALLSGSNLTTTGLQNGDAIVSATGTYASANAGSGIRVTSPSAVGSIGIANNGIPVFGYTLTGSPVSANIGQITPKQLTAQIIGDPTKVYDGTTTATLSSSNYEIDGFIGSDGATVKQPSSIAYAGSDAGSQTVNATFSVTNFTASSGTNLNNYTLPTTATGLGLITQAPLLVSGLLANNKVYDGTTADSIVTSGAKLFGVIQPDQGNVTLDTSGVVGAFAQSNVGNGIGVTLSGFVLGGSQAHNYQLVPPTNLTANITPKALTVGQVTANNKTYDNTTGATLNTGNGVLNGIVGSDNVTLNSSGASAVFGQTDVGTNLAVTTSGFTLGGTASGNYSLVQPSLFANINPALLTITMTGTPEKTYDGTNAVNLGSGNFNITGFIGGQHAVISQSSASYATANAGNGITVTATVQPSDFTPDGGTSLSNYTFAPTVVGTGLGKIDPLQLTGLIVGNPSKVYDGTTTAALSASNFQLVGLVPGQSINASFSGTVAGTYDDPNAGARGVTAGSQPASEFTAGNGTLLSNYILPTTFIGSGSITPAPLTGSFVLNAGIVDATKAYDGSTTITLTGANFTLSGFVNGDSAVVGNNNITGTFGQKNVGTNIPLSAQLAISDLTPTNGTTQTELNNYQIVDPVLGVGNITPAQLIATIINNPTKVYNGSTNVALSSGNIQVTGWANGEGATINPTATAAYDSANASASGGRTITAQLTPGNYSVNNGTLLSNYTIATTATGAGTINQAPLFVTGVFATNRSYNTTTADTLNTAAAGLAGLVDSDVGNVTLNLSNISANFSQANVGNGLTVTANGFSLNGSQQGNYILQPVTGLFANITPATLTLSGVTANNKTYDGTANATLSVAGNATLNGVFSGDTVGFDRTNASGQFITANAGDNLGVAVSGFTLNGGSAGNYQLVQPSGLTASITPKQLSAVIIGSPTKVYDGTPSATLTAADYQLIGFVGSDGASVPQSATANYATKNVGTGLEVDSTLVTSDFLAKPGTNLSNYILPTTGQGFNGVIQPKVIDLTGTRVYDGTTTGDSSLFGTLNGVNGETLGVSGSGTLSSKNVGSQWSFTSLGSLALTDGGNGGLAANYTLIGGTDWVTITPRQITASFTATDKTYDATTSDVVSNAALEAANGNRGLIAGDDVTLNNTTAGQFSDKNVGTGKTVTGNMSISGNDAGNYVFTNGTSTASIDALHITVTATGKNRQYDATVTDSGATVQSAGVIAGDTVNFGFGSATFDDKNVGTGKTVTVTGVSKSGTDAGNYVVDNTTLTTTANITPRVINLSGTRVYDANTDANASVLSSGGTVAGVAGESLALSGQGSTADKTVGNNKTVSLGSLALGDGANGGLASNYTLIGGTDTLTITKAPLTFSFTASNKTYDGTNTATISNQMLTGILGSDTISASNAFGAHFSDKNVGNGKTVFSDIVFAGADDANYNITIQTTTANITPLTITVGATGVNKVYDGNTTDNALLGSTGVKAGDTVNFAGTSVFDDKNVGNGKNVSVSGITASGTDAGNYVLANTTASATANITPFIFNLSATRVYDGTTQVASALFGSNGVLNGVNGEQVQLSGSSNVANKNVGNNKAFNGASDMTLNGLNGALGSNYAIGSSVLTITPLAITGSVTASNKVYDATTTAITQGFLTGVLSGDSVGLSTIGTFSDKNAANGKIVSLVNSLTGTDAGNYLLSANAATSANIAPLDITVDATAANKTYDTTTSALITSLTSSGRLGNDAITFTAVGADFSDANAANGKDVTVFGISKSGADANNYNLVSTTAHATANITPVILNLSGTRVYDGTTGASANLFGNNGVISGIGGQTLNLVGSGAVGDKNVGVNKAFASLGTLGLQDGGNGGLAQNYTLVGGADSLTITPKALTATTTAVSRDYDGTNLAALTGSALSGLVAGDDVTLGNDTQGTFADKNAATGKTVTTAMTVSGGDASNYTFSQPTGVTADINPLHITVDVTAANKDYDTTSNAVLTSIDSAGRIGNDDVNFTFANASFSDANAANGKTVTVTGIAKNGADAANYVINTTAQTTADILPLVIDLSGTRTYDGTTDAVAGLFGNNGVIAGIAGQTLNLVGNGAVGDKNVGVNKAFASLGTLSLQDGGNGGLAQNYTLIGGNDVLTITPKAISLGAVAANKTYDATDLANVVVNGNGVLTGDDIQFAPGSANFATSNAGNGIGVNVAGITASGLDAGNYSFASTASTNANITPVVLDLSGTRVYDGSTSANAGLFGNNGVLAGVAGQTVNLAGSGVLTDKNVGNNKAFSSLGTLTLQDGGNGGLAGNYTLVGGNDTLSVTPRAITVDATGSNKTYDGNTTAGVSLGSSGVLGGDQVSFAPGSANYASANAGNGIAIDVNGITASGTDAGNYSFATVAQTSGNITPVVLDLTGTRVYDGTTGAVASLFGNQGVLSGVNGETLTLSGSGTVGDKNVGSQKPFAANGLAGFSLSGNNGALASNYTLAGGNDWLSITPATLTVIGTQTTNRVYDGTRIDALSGATLAGVFGQDNVLLGNDSSGLFANKNVGQDKAVTTAMTISGSDASNYVLVQPTGLVADVTPRQLVVSATGTDRMFDGTTTDQTSLSSTGVLAGDQVSFSSQGGNFNTSAPGNGKTVTVTGITASGPDAANYVIADPTTTTTADITGAQPTDFGIGNGQLAQLQAVLGPSSIATPYGVADADVVGNFTGNQKKTHRPIERNRAQADFKPGLGLQVIDGGVRAPVNALP